MENDNPRSRLSCTDAGLLIARGQIRIVVGTQLRDDSMVQAGIRDFLSAGWSLGTIFQIARAMIREDRQHPNS